MLNSIINKVKNKPEYFRLLENFFSLSILQVANYIFPLITLPYLVRILKPEKYGLIAFAQAFIGYFMLITDYGFNFTAPREISINRDNKRKLSEIFSSVIIIKLFLFIISLFFMSLIIFLFKKFHNDWFLYYVTFSMILGNIMFPTWFFQGIEKMKFITILNIISKLLFTILIFIFVRKQSDYYLVPFFNSLGFITAGIISLFIVFRNFEIRFYLPDKQKLIHYFKEGWYIFISTIAISLYTTSNTFILGMFTNNRIVGIFSAAEKLIRAVLSLLTPISQTIYPYLSKISNVTKERAFSLIKKLSILVGSFTFIITIIVFVFADLIVKVVLGKEYIESISVLRILSFLPFIIGIATVYATFGLLSLGYTDRWSKIIISASILDLIFNIIFVILFNLKHIGVSLSWLITELYIMLYSIFEYRRVRNANR